MMLEALRSSTDSTTALASAAWPSWRLVAYRLK
jgi:hypothetical protein